MAGSWPGARPAYPGVPAGPTREDRERDSRALRAVEIAAVIALVGFGFSLVTLVLVPFSSFTSSYQTSTGGNATTNVTLNTGLLYVVLGVQGILTIIEFAWYRVGFSTIATHDSRFSTPAALTIVAAIGYALVILGAAILIHDVNQLITSCSSTAGSNLTGGTACVPSSFWEALVLVLVGGIVALVGFIGLLIGIWRLGTRFSDGLFKAGAVLMIFPLLQIVGAILILVAAHGAREKVAKSNPFTPTGF